MEVDHPTAAEAAAAIELKKTPAQTASEKAIFTEAYGDFVQLCKLIGKEFGARALELERLATVAESGAPEDHAKFLTDYAYCVAVLADKTEGLKAPVGLLSRVGHLGDEVSKECRDAWVAGYPGMEVSEDDGCRPMSNQLARAWRIQMTHESRVPRPQGRSPFSRGSPNFAALLAAMAD